MVDKRSQLNDENLKCCTKCNIYKAFSEFHINSKNRDGKPRSVCKLCRKQERKDNADKFREKDRKYNRDNLEKRKEAQRIYYKANYERIKEVNKRYAQNNRERVYENQRRWREKNADHLREVNRKYKEENVEKYKMYYQDYRLNNPEKERAKIHSRRARRKAANGNFTSNEWLNLCDIYNNTCLCCKVNNEKLTPDHVIPLSKGGSNEIENIQPLCLNCNRRKGTKTIDYRS